MGKYVNNDIIIKKQGDLNLAKVVANLSVVNTQKDALIQQLAGTIANMNIEIAQLKGGNN
ncbi:hypothetical protein [Clostridium sp.]|jgi:hypothetical protein|uniref:hypothetical protein n=1 Tax=Clostridium sp. TaxID=1506 RepID=UPI003A27860D